ncbi:MAG TPA: hypothetical protein VEQ85_04475, partial [Lacipirellulaceae bacterium]|nr:hypothetical protein [Lacipirellulaceae bacterium]
GDWSSLPVLEQAAILAAGSAQPFSLVPAGEFESLEDLLQAGWRRSEAQQPGIAGAVRLSPDTPHGGQYCLELEARATAGTGAPPALATAPVWITSPSLQAPPGHVIEITGWVRVAETPIGSADPLLVFDSIGGEESAIRVATAPTWRRFRLVRAAPPGVMCQITIALGGAGRAMVDDLQYRLLPLPAATPMASR